MTIPLLGDFEPRLAMTCTYILGIPEAIPLFNLSAKEFSRQCPPYMQCGNF